MYKVEVNNGFTLLDNEYQSVYFDFYDFQEAIVFIEYVFKYGKNCGVEIIYEREK